MAKTPKILAENRASVDRTKVYTLPEAVDIVRAANDRRKLPETVDISINLGVDPQHANQQVRGMVTLPEGTGKEVRVAVFAKDAKAEEARAAGADLAGADDLIESIKAGNIDFDRCIATPDMMAPVSKALARILGPKGLMPNPKLGTVTPDVAAAVKTAKAGAVQFRAEKGGIIHAGVGKAAFSADKIASNVRAFVTAIIRAKPEGAKGTYVKKITLSSTMGPGVKVNLASITEAA